MTRIFSLLALFSLTLSAMENTQPYAKVSIIAKIVDNHSSETLFSDIKHYKPDAQNKYVRYLEPLNNANKKESTNSIQTYTASVSCSKIALDVVAIKYAYSGSQESTSGNLKSTANGSSGPLELQFNTPFTVPIDNRCSLIITAQKE